MQLSLNTHKPIHRTLKRVNFAFAITTLYERDSTLINVEGRVQKAFKVITPAGRLCRNADGISRVLFIKQRKMRRDSSALRNSQNRPEYLYFEAPFLKTIGELRKKFYLNFLPLQEFQLKINFRPFKPHLTYFFSRDILSLNSLNAARSQLFLEKFTHFN